MLGELIVLVLVLGLLSFVAYRLFPEPFKSIVYAVCVIVLVVWVLRFAGILRY